MGSFFRTACFMAKGQPTLRGNPGGWVLGHGRNAPDSLARKSFGSKQHSLCMHFKL